MAKSMKGKKEEHIEPPAGHTLPLGAEENVQPELKPEEELDLIPDEEEEPFVSPPDEEPPPGEGP